MVTPYLSPRLILYVCFLWSSRPLFCRTELSDKLASMEGDFSMVKSHMEVLNA
jgi:hypothetical protein